MKTLDILWNKYRDLRADVETLKSDVKTISKTNKKVEFLQEELQELKQKVSEFESIGTIGKVNKEVTQGNGAKTTDKSKNRDPIEYIPETTDWQVLGSSMYKDQNGDTVITVDYSSSVPIRNVFWFVDGIIVLDRNRDFSVSGETAGNHLRTKLSAHVPDNQIVGKSVMVNFENQMKYFNRILMVGLTVNTSVIANRNENSSFEVSVSINQSKTTDYFEHIFEFIPNPNSLDYKLNHINAQFSYLNNSKHDGSLQSIGTYDDSLGLVKEIITQVRGYHKVKIKLDNSLESYGRYLKIFASMQLFDNLIEGVTATLHLPGVFMNNGPVDHLTDKFSISRPHLTILDINGTGMITCFSNGYPAPRLEILKVNIDNSTSSIAFENHIRYIQEDHYIEIIMVVPKVSRVIEGRYACVGQSGDVKRNISFDLKVTMKAHFVVNKTTMERLRDGKLVVNVTAFGDPTPDISCMENEEDGDNIEFKYVSTKTTEDGFYGVAYKTDQERNDAEKTTVKTIVIDTANNGTTYGPLYQLVCTASRFGQYDHRKDDLIVVKL